MITAPALSAVRSSPRGGGGAGGGAPELGNGGGGGGAAELPWQSGLAGNLIGGVVGGGGGGCCKAFFHAIPPSDPLRQANRLPIKVLKMLTARTGHILHPEYLQPLPSTPVSPIELDAKKSPLALLAQTCSQIGKPDPSPSSKLSSVTSSGGGGGGDKEASKGGPLKLSDIGAEDKSSFKPYSKPGADKKDSSAVGGSGAASGGSSGGGSSSSSEKTGFRVPSATCPPFTPRTGSPSSSASACSPGLLPGGESKGGGGSSSGGGGGEAEKKEAAESCGKSASDGSGRLASSGGGLSAELSQSHEGAKGLLAGVASAASCSTADSSCSAVPSSVAAAVLGSAGLVAPVSPYKPGQTVFPLPPAGMSYPGSLAGAYAGYPPQFLPPGVALDPSKAGSLGGGGGSGGKAAGSSPLAGASPPSVMTASLCRDPYCLSYHCASHLAAGASCAHEQALKAGGYPLVYPGPPLHAGPPSLAGHPLYPYGFLLPNDPQPHSCNWVSANGPCDKRFATSEELLSHLRTHTAFPGPAEKLLSGYPSSSSLAAAAAAAMACHMHVPTSAAGGPGSPGALALRSPHHALGLSSRYHPYSKSPLPTPGAPVPVPAATGPYYSPYALYGQRLTTASALGYQ
ncbi:zinc finger protein 503 [Pantherophis guttatus]|uniref:Zinc finger protein 503 n=1 Tax=Pantherophis guttatus TaxID=94885 RepID=A0A6P9C932_PANGU|nr:zinc finger protein 503 [Pantherophis guttatus]